MGHKGQTRTPTCAKCGENHPEAFCDGFTICFKCVQTCHFMIEFPKNMQGSDNMAVEPNLLHRLRQTKFHLEELLQGQAEEQTICMLEPVARSKIINLMLSLVCSKSLILMYMHCLIHV